MRGHKKDPEHEIHTSEQQIRCVHSPLREEDKHGNAETELLENGRDHQGTKAQGVPGDEHKRDLPRQRDAHESIEKPRMRDGRRIIAADPVEHEVQRRDDQESPNGRDPKHNLRKFHRIPLLPRIL